MDNKKKIGIIIGIILFIIIIIVCYVIGNNKDNKKDKDVGNEIINHSDLIIDKENLENAEIRDNEKYNNSKDVAENHVIINEAKKETKLEVKDMKLYSKDDATFCEFVVKNNDDVDHRGNIEITFYSKNKSTFYIVIPVDLKAGEEKKEEFFEPSDYINSSDYKVIFTE